MTTKAMIQEIQMGMEVGSFRAVFPQIPMSLPEKKDYDPGLWEETVQYHQYIQAEETVEGIPFDVSGTFLKGRLVFLQYFGRPANTEGGYTAGCRSFTFLASQMTRILGRPAQSTSLKTYADFAAETRITSGPPDDRYVEACSHSWNGPPGGWILFQENAYGSLTLELRIGS